MITHDEAQMQLRRLKELRDTKDVLKAQLSDNEKAMDALNQELTEYFEANDISNLTVNGVGQFIHTTTTYPKVEDKDACYTWLKHRGDFEMLASINHNTFRAFYNGLMEAGEALPPGVTQYTESEIRIRR